MAAFGRTIDVGSTVLVAELTETGPELVDADMASSGGTVHRRSAASIAAELEASARTEQAARDEADRVLRQQRRAERRERFAQRKQSVKDKLHSS